MDDPLEITSGTAIPLAAIEIRTSRSSGPGGQHANVTASRVEATLEIASCEALSPEQRERLIERFGPRVSAVAQDTRSQTRNRELAVERLRARIAEALTVSPPRRPTRPSRTAVAKRLDDKRRQSERKRDRRADDWK
jgi:ribosome-associated protein